MSSLALQGGSSSATAFAPRSAHVHHNHHIQRRPLATTSERRSRVTAPKRVQCAVIMAAADDGTTMAKKPFWRQLANAKVEVAFAVAAVALLGHYAMTKKMIRVPDLPTVELWSACALTVVAIWERVAQASRRYFASLNRWLELAEKIKREREEIRGARRALASVKEDIVSAQGAGTSALSSKMKEIISAEKARTASMSALLSRIDGYIARQDALDASLQQMLAEAQRRNAAFQQALLCKA